MEILRELEPTRSWSKSVDEGEMKSDGGEDDVLR